MRLFDSKKDGTILIIGCGRLGNSLACAMSSKEWDVTVIDPDETALKRLPSSYSGSVLLGDGTDSDILEFAGIRKADALVAATDDDATNIMIAQIADCHYPVKNILAYINDISKAISCSEMNITVLCPAALSVYEAQRVLLHDKEAKTL